MADTGYNWDDTWTEVVAATVQQEGEGSVVYTSAALSLDGKAACEISIDTDYSAHALSGVGLVVQILRECGTGDYEDPVNNTDVPWGFEMTHTNNGTNRKVFTLLASQFMDFKIHLSWENATTDAVATTDVDIRYATIPVAS